MKLNCLKVIFAWAIFTMSSFANAGLITNVDVENGISSESYQGGTLLEGVTSHVDRDYEYSAIPSWLLGADFVQVANDDKFAGDDFSIDVTLSERSWLYLFIDDRVDVSNSNMSWVTDNGFTDTNINIVSKGWAGELLPLSIYSKMVTSGVTTTYQVNEGEFTIMYGIAAVAVPEPSTLAIFALGMIGLVSRRFKKQ